MTTNTNVSSFGADILKFAKMSGALDTSAIMLASKYATELQSLRDKITHAKANEESVRSVILDYWFATPEGEAVQKEYDTLKTLGKTRSVQQNERFSDLFDMQNAANTTIGRTVDTYAGVVRLRNAKREVNLIETRDSKGKLSGVWTCLVISTETHDDGSRKEIELIPFNSTQLQKIAALPATAIADDMQTSAIRALTVSGKKGAPNKQPANATPAVERAKLGETAQALETAITGSFDDGRLQGVSQKTRHDVMQLWAAIERQASAEEKAAALAEYDKLAAGVAEAEAAEKAKAEAVKAEAEAKANKPAKQRKVK